MEYEWEKVENCFKDSRTFEYRLPFDGKSLSAMLSGWEVKENHKFRRPLFTADKGGVNIKGILKANIIKVSFPEDHWETAKADFERWLTEWK